MNYYNDIDPYAQAAIRALIENELIPNGDVDGRSIEDVTPSDISGYTQCHFFAGVAGWPLALALAGVSPSTKLWTGSCPCQPFSAAGDGHGFADKRHLWPSWYWLIEQCKPPIVFGEQVASKLASAWVDLVHADMEALGYAFGCVPFTAAGVGALHVRERNYWFARSAANTKWNEQPRQEPCGGQAGRMGRVEQSVPWNEPWQSALSRFRALGDGLPRCVAASDLARNAIVPQQAAAFIRSCVQ